MGVSQRVHTFFGAAVCVGFCDNIMYKVFRSQRCHPTIELYNCCVKYAVSGITAAIMLRMYQSCTVVIFFGFYSLL